MGMLNYAKVIITLNCNNKPHTKQFNNCEWVSIIQTIYVNVYALFPYVIIKKMSFFFDIKIMIYLTHGVYNLVKIIKSLMKLI